MLKIGSYNELVVVRAAEFGLYLRADSPEVLLPGKYVPEGTQPGDRLRVFVYTDSEDRPVATTVAPKAVVGEFAYLKMTDSAPFGVFMDWGLEKDLLIPRREQQVRMTVGEKYMVKVCLDQKTRRVFGTCKIAANCDTDVTDLNIGMPVKLLIYSRSKLGIKAIVNHRYLGMLYNSEIFEELSEGEKRLGYINRLRADGKIDLSLKKPGFASVSGSANTVMAALRKAGGRIACHDKSPPADIKERFSMSKKEFKRTIGGLYRKGLIEISESGICLKKKDPRKRFR